MCGCVSVCECLHGGVHIPVCIQKLGEGTASLDAGVAGILWDPHFVARVLGSGLGVEEEDARNILSVYCLLLFRTLETGKVV